MNIKTDELIRDDVIAELSWDNRVRETRIGVTVSRGVVTLTGTVTSFAKKLAAQDAAHRVDGVLDVANDIQVIRSDDLALTDTDIAKAVRHTLEWDVFVPDTHIRSTVSDGWVTLEGEVETYTQREDAERAVRHLAGVVGMRNLIVVRKSLIAPEEVRGVIEDVLERRVDRMADRIRISVDHGEVTLSGKVRSYAEKRAVIGAVSHTRGVHFVKDHLLVQRYD
ncbi:MAG: BON domain-containing protein [Acidobacteria bacterium]|nr:BON domain-containing protein [Acidobacteriota bacterium]